MKELGQIQAELKAPKGQVNKFGGFRYRSCEDILEAVKPLLAKNCCTLTLFDDITEIGGRIYVKANAVLTNAAGEHVQTQAFAREEAEKKGMDAAQITGAASSYARKYALNGLFCIDDTKDADATNNGGQAQTGTIPKEIQDLAAMVKNDVKIATSADAVKAIWTGNAKYFKLYPALHAEIKKMVIEKGQSF